MVTTLLMGLTTFKAVKGPLSLLQVCVRAVRSSSAVSASEVLFGCSNCEACAQPGRPVI